jgi:hypothetical protein
MALLKQRLRGTVIKTPATKSLQPVPVPMINDTHWAVLYWMPLVLKPPAQIDVFPDHQFFLKTSH